MSHFTNLTTEIRDLEACKKALENMGLQLQEYGECRYYYGVKEMENVVKLPTKYDMALTNNHNGSYSIQADFDEGYVEEVIGRKGSALLREYGEEMLKKTAKKLHLSITHPEKNAYKLRNPQDPNGGYMMVYFEANGELRFEPKGIKGKNCSKFIGLEDALGKVTKREFLPEYYGKTGVKEKDKKERVKVGGY